MPYPSYNDFINLIGACFRVSLDGIYLKDLTLKSVSSHQPAVLTDPAQLVRSFSILFESTGEPVLPQKIYSLEHVEVGAFDLFIVPLGHDKVSWNMRYEAIFN